MKSEKCGSAVAKETVRTAKTLVWIDPRAAQDNLSQEERDVLRRLAANGWDVRVSSSPSEVQREAPTLIVASWSVDPGLKTLSKFASKCPIVFWSATLLQTDHVGRQAAYLLGSSVMVSFATELGVVVSIGELRQ
jgi:hypothetical protein